MDPAMPPHIIGIVKAREESYRKLGRMKMFLILGNWVAIVDSASRLVVMYRFGRIGVPSTAEIKTKEPTDFLEDS